MGMEQAVAFPAGVTPFWPAVRALLVARGLAVQMRMIDGELAFPDEEPPATWRELRLGFPQGMVTVRREPGRVVFVVWGNAAPELVQARNALTWAFAEAWQGRVEAGQGLCTAAEYARGADLPAGFRTDAGR